MILVPSLRTERLVLRPLTAADFPAFAALNADADVARFLSPDGKPLPIEDSWRQLAMLIGHWQLRGFGMWALATREYPDHFIGRVGAHQPEGWPDFEIGWAVARSCWNRGYATEGAGAAIRYAFEVLERPRVVSLIHPENVRSRAVAERVGERRSGAWVLRGQSLDVYSIERDDWLAVQRT
jgi:RimJ/RimL family protein N-acetyltransferase